MDTARLFVALPIERGICKELSKDFLSLDLPWDKIKKASEDQFHLTLKFLGPTPITKIPTILEVLESVKIDIDFLELSIDKVAIFNPHNPRVLAISLKNNTELQKLYDQIDQALFEANIANKEIRQFRPHLTMGRIKKSVQVEELSDFLNWQPHKNFSIHHFELLESVLEKRGPQYTTLQAFNIC